MYNSRFSSVKAYYRYSFGAIFSGLLCLALLGTFAVLAFFPLFSFTPEGENEVMVNGLTFVFYGLRKFLPDLYKGELAGFENCLAAYGDTNQFLVFLAKFHEYVEWGLVGFLAVALLLAAIVGIIGVFWILLGRIHFNKAPASISKAVLTFYILFIGLLFLYMFFANEIIKGGSGNAKVSFTHLIPFILIGAQLVIVIALSITYSMAFKDRVFAKRPKKGEKNNAGQVEFVENKPAQNPAYAQPQPQPQPQPVNNYNNPQAYYPGTSAPQTAPAPATSAPRGPVCLPDNLKEIGPSSFARNTTLQDATIPSGISKIGASAFSNCLNLETVTIPLSVRDIGYNCFFNTPKLRSIVYLGTVEDWKRVTKGSNWLSHSGANIIDAKDGRIAVSNK